MDEVFTRWPHATLANIYQMFPQDGATPQQIAAGSAVIGVLENFWETSSPRHTLGIGSASTCSAMGIDFEWTNANAIYVGSIGIRQMPLLLKQVLNAAFPDHAAFLEQSDRRRDHPAPYHGPSLLHGARHPFLSGVLGLLGGDDWAALKWVALSSGLKIVGAPMPPEAAMDRISEALGRSSSGMGDHVEHIKTWLGTPPHDLLGQLCRTWFPDAHPEMALAMTMSRFIYTDEKIDAQEAWNTRRMSLQTRLRFLLHFPGAAQLFEPYADLSAELMGLRRAVDEHRGDMLGELESLVDLHVDNPDLFRQDPCRYIDAEISLEADKRQRLNEEAIEAQRVEDERFLHDLRTLGSAEVMRRLEKKHGLAAR